MRYCKIRVKMFSNKKLYKRLTRLQEFQKPDTRSIDVILSEIAQRNPVEFEDAKIEVEVEKSKRHMVREVKEILYYEIKYYEDYLAKPASETDPYERKLRAAKLQMVQQILAHR
ncbi:hypothetical protein QMA09_09100 [Planococcus sp. APC 3906]|uniref:hypothetical protein n=1 Tax=Planococcus sp. APC 3906 TaxID=3035194 RepID=UPI0025B4DAD0|nr:hypothetical protein [Planococcus sp. APC 3906]MDN3450347.1 hypothetical protein [Planococcus sp. APC 3906]